MPHQRSDEAVTRRAARSCPPKRVTVEDMQPTDILQSECATEGTPLAKLECRVAALECSAELYAGNIKSLFDQVDKVHNDIQPLFDDSKRYEDVFDNIKEAYDRCNSTSEQLDSLYAEIQSRCGSVDQQLQDLGSWFKELEEHFIILEGHVSDSQKGKIGLGKPWCGDSAALGGCPDDSMGKSGYGKSWSGESTAFGGCPDDSKGMGGFGKPWCGNAAAKGGCCPDDSKGKSGFGKSWCGDTAAIGGCPGDSKGKCGFGKPWCGNSAAKGGGFASTRSFVRGRSPSARREQQQQQQVLCSIHGKLRGAQNVYYSTRGWVCKSGFECIC